MWGWQEQCSQLPLELPSLSQGYRQLGKYQVSLPEQQYLPWKKYFHANYNFKQVWNKALQKSHRLSRTSFGGKNRGESGCHSQRANKNLQCSYQHF